LTADRFRLAFALPFAFAFFIAVPPLMARLSASRRSCRPVEDLHVRPATGALHRALLPEVSWGAGG
jgi:hypothetical protein